MASFSVISGGGDDIIEPKVTKTTPAFPELERNRLRSSDKGAGGLGSKGPTNTVSGERVKNTDWSRVRDFAQDRQKVWYGPASN